MAALPFIIEGIPGTKGHRILAAIRHGMPLGEARRQHGYKALRTRGS
jgi:hypothetical protein